MARARAPRRGRVRASGDHGEARAAVGVDRGDRRGDASAQQRAVRRHRARRRIGVGANGARRDAASSGVGSDLGLDRRRPAARGPVGRPPRLVGRGVRPRPPRRLAWSSPTTCFGSSCTCASSTQVCSMSPTTNATSRARASRAQTKRGSGRSPRSWRRDSLRCARRAASRRSTRRSSTHSTPGPLVLIHGGFAIARAEAASRDVGP